MWYFQALGAAISLALLGEMLSREQGSLIPGGERTQGWRYRDLSRSRTLWLECLLYGQLARNQRYPDIYLQFLAESAFAAAWASLDFWDAEQRDKDKVQEVLTETAGFLDTLKPERQRSGIPNLRRRLQRISGQGDARTEVWAYIIGHWLQTTAGIQPLSVHQELSDLGWPLASFGLTFWSRETPCYRKDGALYRLIQPFDLVDAFGLYGPFERVDDSRGAPKGEKLVLACLVNTKGLKSPPIWELEGLLGGIPGVLLTRNGHVHRQFPGNEMPEWFEAVEVTYESAQVETKDILFNFWSRFYTAGDLLFYTSETQRQRCFEVWEEFRSRQPDWAVPHKLELRPCNWFEPAEFEDQKKALQGIPVLRTTFQNLDFTNSCLATKINAFASGNGDDEDVVLLSARHGFSDGLTLALRTIRYFKRALSSAPHLL